MSLIKRINKQAIIILLPLSILSAFIDWKKLPISILIGGVLGLANLKGLAWGVKGLIGAARPNVTLVFLSFLRLFIIAFILGILLYYRLINLIGILIGFTVVFVFVVKEGLRAAKESSIEE